MSGLASVPTGCWICLLCSGSYRNGYQRFGVLPGFGISRAVPGGKPVEIHDSIVNPVCSPNPYGSQCPLSVQSRRNPFRSTVRSGTTDTGLSPEESCPLTGIEACRTSFPGPVPPVSQAFPAKKIGSLSETGFFPSLGKTSMEDCRVWRTLARLSMNL